jgi:hypothetical protein
MACAFDKTRPAENGIGAAYKSERHSVRIGHGHAGRRADDLLANIGIEKSAAAA